MLSVGGPGNAAPFGIGTLGREAVHGKDEVPEDDAAGVWAGKPV